MLRTFSSVSKIHVASMLRSSLVASSFQHAHAQPQQRRQFSSRSIGIVGLPNVGKSTLFNAILECSKAEAANYPFCTIEPNVGVVTVPDDRLEKLAEKAKSKRKLPAQIEFIDIAGLVRGAHKGEGLGNKFLANIRSVNQVIQMVRCFKNENITHVDTTVDPLRDIDTILIELALADLDTLAKRKVANKKIKDPKLQAYEAQIIEECEQALNNNTPVFKIISEKLRKSEGKWNTDIESFYNKVYKEYNLLTAKKFIFVLNVSDTEAATGNELTRLVQDKYRDDPDIACLVVSADLEFQCSMMDTQEERIGMLKEYGLKEPAMRELIRKSYELANCITYFTIGPEEARAWTIKKGTNAQDAAAEIHTDISNGFIKADVIGWEDYLKYDCDDKKARAANKIRSESKNYIVQDGDVFYFHHRSK